MAVETGDVEALIRAMLKVEEERRDKLNDRIYGLQAIAAHCGVTDETVKTWVERHGFPLDKDPKGYSVQRWNMARWFDARRQACEGFGPPVKRRRAG